VEGGALNAAHALVLGPPGQPTWRQLAPPSSSSMVSVMLTSSLSFRKGLSVRTKSL
jgi:hypothetical protein